MPRTHARTPQWSKSLLCQPPRVLFPLDGSTAAWRAIAAAIADVFSGGSPAARNSTKGVPNSMVVHPPNRARNPGASSGGTSGPARAAPALAPAAPLRWHEPPPASADMGASSPHRSPRALAAGSGTGSVAGGGGGWPSFSAAIISIASRKPSALA